MDDFYSREITLADMPFLMHEFEEGARLGHLQMRSSRKPVGRSLKKMREAIKIRDANGESGHFIFILLRRSDDKKIGLIWFTLPIDPAGDPVLNSVPSVSLNLCRVRDMVRCSCRI
ncbi:hypothetical protein RBI80_29340 (plasmid) [Klebsiella variicola]|nr:hypothetical protein RBI80_29340 [Klebsiella variicola]